MSINKTVFRVLAVTSALAAVVACGGGEGAGAAGSGGSQVQAGNTSDSQQNRPLSIQFGTSAPDTPVRVRLNDVVPVSAIVRDANGLAQPNVLVTFTAPANATLTPTLGTALTDANGVATVQLRATQQGAALLTVAATVGSTQRTATLAFEVI